MALRADKARSLLCRVRVAGFGREVVYNGGPKSAVLTACLPAAIPL